MPAASTNQFPKVILEERASDGSDTSNPAADHRALFLGEDGLLHLRDSAGNVTDIGSGSGGSTVKSSAPIVSTGGDITTSSTTWAELAATSGGPGTGVFDMDFTGVVAGDIAYVSIAYSADAGAGYQLVTVATMVSGSPVNYFGGRTGATAGSGCMCWQAVASRVETKGGVVGYAIQSGDLSAGALKLRPYTRVHASSRLMNRTAADPVYISGWVVHP